MPIEGKAISHQAARDIEPASASAQEERSARGAFPLAADEAMIREVHVYGAVAALGHASTGARTRGWAASSLRGHAKSRERQATSA